jgi:hypothetical protein
MKRALFILSVVAVALAVPAAVMLAGGKAQPKPVISPPQSNAFGMSLPEFATEWWKWAWGIPAFDEDGYLLNPLFDETGELAAVGQGDRFWFLAGTFYNVIPEAHRVVDIPPGTPLIFPIQNGAWLHEPENGEPPWYEPFDADGDGEPDYDTYEDYVAEILTWVMDEVYVVDNLFCTIDGVEVSAEEMAKTAVITPTFVADIPEGSVRVLMTGDPPPPPLEPGPHYAMAMGYYLRIPPLSAGKHTIEIGIMGGDDILMYVTYDITVGRAKKK